MDVHGATFTANHPQTVGQLERVNQLLLTSIKTTGFPYYYVPISLKIMLIMSHQGRTLSFLTMYIIPISTLHYSQTPQAQWLPTRSS